MKKHHRLSNYCRLVSKAVHDRGEVSVSLLRHVARGEEDGGRNGKRETRVKNECRAGKSVRLREITLPLAALCLARAEAAAGSDCTPLKQRAAVIRPLSL